MGPVSLFKMAFVSYLGVNEVEVWRLRAVGRDFRYGVAFAYERAQGLGPSRRHGGEGPVYDISQAALPLATQIGIQEGELPGGEQQNEEDRESSSSRLQTQTSVSVFFTEEPQESSSPSEEGDVTIDEVRHLPPSIFNRWG